MIPLDFGRPTTAVRIGTVSRRLDLRILVVTALLALAAFAVSVVSLGLGDITLTVPEVLHALFGDASRKAELVVTQWRLPRVAVGLVIGFALGVSGAIFQSLTRNPLGSPDVIGFSSGAYTGALIAIVVLHGSQLMITVGAVVGGCGVGLLIYLLAWRDGVQGFRLIVVGIGISAMLASVNTWIILQSDLMIAMTAAVWGAGSLSVTPPGSLLVGGLCLSLAMVAMTVLLPQARLLESGAETAQALGVRIQSVRAALMIIGVVLVALATAVAGPIGFVALVAPQLAQRLTGAPGLQIWPAGAMGALLLVGCDTVARLAFAPQQLPVGVVTVSVGGLYLVWLLIREARK
jgi:iron complex transport system permease protein